MSTEAVLRAGVSVVPVMLLGMTSWIKCGVMAWVEDGRYRDDETVLVYFRGTTSAAMAEGLSAQRRPPFAYGNDTAPGDWGMIVHLLSNPILEDFDGIDYRRL